MNAKDPEIEYRNACRGARVEAHRGTRRAQLSSNCLMRKTVEAIIWLLKLLFNLYLWDGRRAKRNQNV